MRRKLLLRSDRFSHTNDPWFCHDGKQIHAFLQGTNSPYNKEDACFEGGIGHLTSQDGLRWQEHSTALIPNRPGTYDDAALYSGSTLYHNDTFYLFYAGRQLAESCRIERLFLATSTDGFHFTRYSDEPILVPEGQYYEIRPIDSQNGTVNWRDPDVMYIPEEKKFYMVFCARSSDHQSAIGLAVSDDLFNWKVLPPLFKNPRSHMMECPHWMKLGKRYVVCYSQGVGWLTALGKRIVPPEAIEDGIHYYFSDSILGPWEPGRRALIGTSTGCRTRPYAGAPLTMGGITYLSYKQHCSEAYAPFKQVVFEEGECRLKWNASIETMCGTPIAVVPDYKDDADVGFRFSLSAAMGRDGIVSGIIKKEQCERAGILFRADEWGWKGMYLTWNFAASTVEFGAQSDPGPLVTRFIPRFAHQHELRIKLLILDVLFEFYIEDYLALSIDASIWEDLGHDRIGVVDVGGSAKFEQLVFRPVSMSDGRAFW